MVICSVRDILQDNRNPARIKETVDAIDTHFDSVLVHGDPRFAALEETFPAAADIQGKLHYTGLVAGPPLPSASVDATEGEILVSAGGGATESGRLLRAALDAHAHSALGGRPWRLLAGPNLPAGELAALAGALPAGVSVEPNRGDFHALLGGAAVSVSQAGYNTVAEILQAGCRSVVVPYAGNGETEQSFRAARLHARGLAQMVADADLGPETLAAAIETAFRGPRPRTAGIDLGGAEKSARLVTSWLRE